MIPLIARPFTVAMLLLAADVAWAQGNTDKQPIPDDDAQQQAATLIGKLFKSEYDAAKRDEQKSELAKKLLQVGIDSKDDPTGRYVLFRIAKDMAAGAGDAETALRAVSRLEGEYEVDGLAMRAATLAKLAEALRLPTDHQTLAATIQHAFDEAIAQDRFDLAKAIHETALDSARRARASELVKQVVSEGKKLDELQAEYARISGALATLQTSPTDAEANLAVGRYQCFTKGQWESGLLMLALGEDEQLKSLAISELAEPPDALALGNAWWDYAETAEGKVQSAARRRAALWYHHALPRLSGLTEAQVKQRLEAIKRTEGAVQFAGGDFGRELSGLESPPSEWISLFDGMTLNGWTGEPKFWKVINGVIVGDCPRHTGTPTQLVHKDKFSDFKLKAKFRISKGRSGVWFRFTRHADYRLTGYNADLFKDGNSVGALISSDDNGGTVVDATGAKNENLLASTRGNHWNEFLITAIGDRIVVEVNGITTVDIHHPEGERAGHIGLQLHNTGTTVEFRDIQIQPIEASKLRGRPSTPGLTTKDREAHPEAPWIDALQSVDPQRHALTGPWFKQNTNLIVKAASKDQYHACMLPYIVDGDFDLWIEFTRTQGDEYMGIMLPVADRHVHLVLFSDDNSLSGISEINGKAHNKNPSGVPSSTRNGVRRRLQISVRYTSDNIEISSTLDEEEFVQWRGPQNALSVSVKLPPKMILLGGRFNVSGVYHVVRLRMVNGLAKPLQ